MLAAFFFKLSLSKIVASLWLENKTLCKLATISFLFLLFSRKSDDIAGN